MKYSLLIVLFLSLPICAQVGIGTTFPTATLDINGDLRLRGTNEETNIEVAQDSVLVISRNGTVNRITSKRVVNSALKSAVKGTFSSSSDVSLTLVSQAAPITFDGEDFDTNSEYDITSYTFIAKENGIYDIYSQIKASASVALATNFGLTILKNNAVVSKNSFANINVLGINVTPSVRAVQTLVELLEGDTVSFEIVCDLASVTILGNNTESFFTIHQIR